MMTGTAGKGSRRRATQVDQKEADDNWDRIFAKKQLPRAGDLLAGDLLAGERFSITDGGVLYEAHHIKDDLLLAHLDDDPRLVANFALTIEVFLDVD